MNYYKQGDAAKAKQIKAAFEKEGYDVTGFDMCNDNILFFTYELEGGGKVISTTNANLYTANIIKTHPDYKELELPPIFEPKFKVGDTIRDIVNGENRTYRIIGIYYDTQHYLVNGGSISFLVQDFYELVDGQPKFEIGDVIYSIHDPSIRYRILDVGILDFDTKEPQYRVELLSTEFKGVQRFMSIDKVDNWGVLLSDKIGG